MKHNFWANKNNLLSLLFTGLRLLLGAGILSFGLYNFHQQADITEGGVFGLNLLLNHWFGVSIAIISPILDFIIYLLAIAYLGKKFLIISSISTFFFACSYSFWEAFQPLFPNLSNAPLIAAILGGLFVGCGAGIIIRNGGSSGGDDILALIISAKSRCSLSIAYFICDAVVLGISLSYISVDRIIYSLITVIVSSYTVGYMHRSTNIEYPTGWLFSFYSITLIFVFTKLLPAHFA